MLIKIARLALGTLHTPYRSTHPRPATRHDGAPQIFEMRYQHSSYAAQVFEMLGASPYASQAAGPALELSDEIHAQLYHCLLYTSPSPRDKRQSRMPSSA